MALSVVGVSAVTSSQPVVITDSFRQLDGHSSRVVSLSWSPHQDGFLATASYDWLSLVLVSYISLFLLYSLFQFHPCVVSLDSLLLFLFFS